MKYKIPVSVKKVKQKSINHNKSSEQMSHHNAKSKLAIQFSLSVPIFWIPTERPPEKACTAQSLTLSEIPHHSPMTDPT